MAIEARFGQILGAACDAFARRGYHQASTRDIARAAGLSLRPQDHQRRLRLLERAAPLTTKRQGYVARGFAIRCELDPHARSGDELLSATNLFSGC